MTQEATVDAARLDTTEAPEAAEAPKAAEPPDAAEAGEPAEAIEAAEAGEAAAALVPAPVARTRTRWWIPVLAIVVVLGGSAGAYVGSGYLAHEARNELIVEVNAIEARAEEAVGDWRAARTLATAAAADGTAVSEVVVEGLGSAELAATLTAAAEEAGALVDAAEGEPKLPEPIVYDASAVRPASTSILEIFATRERAAKLEAELDRLTRSAAELDAAADAADEARTAFYASAAQDATAALAEHSIATYETRIAVQHGIDQKGTGWAQSRDSRGAYADLAAAVDAMKASSAAEAARRAESDYAVRGPIEDFARSIAHGVNLDFTWAHVVNGHSSDEWYSGTAMYRDTDGGWATIELSHSIGWYFSDDINAKAVVVHEVGHAQVVRPECKPLFTGPVFASDDEMWATAWAIAKGYDTSGAGIGAYGRPSDAQIAEAGKCI